MRANIHNPFDIVMKRMLESDPVAMLRFAGLPGEAAEPFDADLSTVRPPAALIGSFESAFPSQGDFITEALVVA